MLFVAAEKLCLTVNLDESKVIVFRKGGFLTAKKKKKMVLRRCSTRGGEQTAYLGLAFSTGHSFTAAMEDTSV